MIALVLAATLISPARPATSLVGLWESAKTSVGGIGRSLEFRADGAFVEAAIVIVDGHYRVLGDRLVVGAQAAGSDPDQGRAPRFKVEGDELVQTEPDGAIVRKTRLGRAEEGKPAIVGVWRYRHYTQVTAFERYTDDGRMLFRLPMSSSAGCYFLTANEVLLTRPNRPDVKLTIDVRGDVLSLSGSDGRTTDYRRLTAGAWYDAEHIDRQRPK